MFGVSQAAQNGRTGYSVSRLHGAMMSRKEPEGMSSDATGSRSASWRATMHAIAQAALNQRDVSKCPCEPQLHPSELLLSPVLAAFPDDARELLSVAHVLLREHVMSKISWSSVTRYYGGWVDDRHPSHLDK